MIKTLFLKVEYLDLKKLTVSKSQEHEMRLNLFKKSIKEFKLKMKECFDNKSLKIINQNPFCEIVVEYEDVEIYDKLLKCDIVEVIDSQIYNYDK